MCSVFWETERSKRYGYFQEESTSRRKVLPAWREMPMNPEVHCGVVLTMSKAGTWGTQKATRTGPVRKAPWRRNCPYNFSISVSWEREEGKERNSREEEAGWTKGQRWEWPPPDCEAACWKQCGMHGVRPGKWDQHWLSVLHRVFQTLGSWVFSTGIPCWKQGLKRISRQLTWGILSVKGFVG